MHRAIPVTLATAALFVVVWQFEPAIIAPSTPVAQAPSQTTTSGAGVDNADQSVAGSTESTRWGPVQVQAVFTNGELVDIQVLQAPNDGPTNRALPILRTDALEAKSADIDTVSGATQTSEAYLSSLQAAIDTQDN
jgi:uncharacterized protein with FMN-binding domain